MPERDHEHEHILFLLHKLLLPRWLLLQFGILYLVRAVRGGHVLLRLSDVVHDVPGQHVRGRGRDELHGLPGRLDVARRLDVVLRVHLFVRRVRVNGDGLLVSHELLFGFVSNVRQHLHLWAHREPVLLRRGARA